MRSAVVTGMAAISAAGEGLDRFEDALKRGEPLGSDKEIATGRVSRRWLRLARIESFDPVPVIGAAAARRLSQESRMATAAALLAWKDARASERPMPPERTGSFTGTGLGCIHTTAVYLGGVFREGMASASPQLFSESLASAPLGHTAIALDARGPSVAFQCGDTSAIAVIAAARRAILSGRIDRAICVCFEFLPPPLLPVLGRVAGKRKGATLPLFGEGVVAFVLEELQPAHSTKARVYAAIRRCGFASDPEAPLHDWSRDADAWQEAQARAIAEFPFRSVPLGREIPACVVACAPPVEAAAKAESKAIERCRLGQKTIIKVHDVFGAHAAAGGFSIVAGALRAFRERCDALVSAGACGGATAAVMLSSPAD